MSLAVRASSVVFALLLCGPAPSQTVTVPAGTALVVRTKAPIDTGRVGMQFAAVLVEDVVVDYLGVAATGEICTGAVVARGDGKRTLAITKVQTPLGTHSVAAGEPLYGADPAGGARVVGFAGALPGPPAAPTSRAGQPVVFDAERTVLPAGSTLEFELSAAWEVPLRETESVFPQPEGAQAGGAQEPQVPAGWYAHVDRVAQQQRQREQQQQQRQAVRANQGRTGIHGTWHKSYGKQGWAAPMSTVQPMRSLTPAELAAMRPAPATLPAGTAVVARINEPIDSSRVEPGAPFGAALMTDLVAEGQIVFPRGSAARGVIAVGQLGEALAPTPALTTLQRGAISVGIRTGASQILHWPAPATSSGGVGLGSMAAKPESPWSTDGVLRLPAGTIVAFELAQPVTVR